ncbi:MAG: hypothetical protein RIF33_16600 [Cyclobacteriaceae bacterium]
MMKVKIVFNMLLILQYSANAQLKGVTLPDGAEDILQVLSSERILDKAISRFAGKITSCQFDGDYSFDRVHPDRPPNTISLICTSPITFQTSIHTVLKDLDDDYDSLFFQNQLKEAQFTDWTDQSFNLPEGHKFIQSRWSKYLHSETGRLSIPIFNETRDLAAIIYSTTKRNGTIKKREAVYILASMTKAGNLLGQSHQLAIPLNLILPKIRRTIIFNVLRGCYLLA